jgi:nicotinate-nucleotide adenylyltransferase
MNKIGIIGGSFNPVHNAHLVIADNFCSQFKLDKILFIPAYQSPFKNRDEYIIDDLLRINMLEIAININPKFEIELYEIFKKDISFTIDTIQYLKIKYPLSSLFLLIGRDQSKLFHKWKNWQEILLKTQVCIASRNNKFEIFDEEVNKFIVKNNIKIEILNNTEMEISSTEIRKRILANQNISDLLPAKVAEYIELNNLYK